MSMQSVPPPSLEDHEKAWTETAFLLDIFTATIDNIMGGATASVGRIAGREMARKLPIYLDHPSIRQTFDTLKESLKAGWEFDATETDGAFDVKFSKCVIRQVCEKRSLRPGCELCKLFHYYFDGMVNEIISRPTKSTVVEAGSSCKCSMKVQ